MIGNLMACGFDLSNQLRVAYSPFSDKKERSLRVVACKDFENLRRKNEVRAIVERQGNNRKRSLDSIRNVGSKLLNHAEEYHWFYPKYEQNNCDEYAYQKRHFDLPIRDTRDYS